MVTERRATLAYVKEYKEGKRQEGAFSGVTEFYTC